MISNRRFYETAENPNYIGIPYKTLDCQAFVEKVLADCGEKHDWRGSNHMWREALSWKGTVDECIKRYGIVPLGAWLFTVKNDGGEKMRGYNDNEGNASHVGIRITDGAVHSTLGGVQRCPFPDTRWTHVGLCKYIEYDMNNGINQCLADIDKAMELLKGVRAWILNY